jgi:hypothetical protein
MKTFGRITALVLIVVGMLLVLGAIAGSAIGAARGLLHSAAAIPQARGAGVSGMLLFVLLFAHGLLVMGVGEGLYMLTDLASRKPTAQGKV